MREILFRGKRIDSEPWLEGSLVNNMFFKRDTREPVCYIVDPKENEGYDSMEDFESIAVEVIPETVGQFTGLHDKNGFTKIFEGDIIRLDGTIGGNIYEEKELFKDTTNLIIKGVGTSSWATTEQEAIMRGCHYAE